MVLGEEDPQLSGSEGMAPTIQVLTVRLEPQPCRGQAGRAARAEAGSSEAPKQDDTGGTQPRPRQAREQNRQQGWLFQTCLGQGGAWGTGACGPQLLSEPLSSSRLSLFALKAAQGSVG